MRGREISEAERFDRKCSALCSRHCVMDDLSLVKGSAISVVHAHFRKSYDLFG
jgi:hypothetical protein